MRSLPEPRTFPWMVWLTVVVTSLVAIPPSAWSQTPIPPSSDYSLSASPNPLSIGGLLTVSWARPAGANGFIGLYAPGTPKEFAYADYRYPTSTGNSGTVTFPAPSAPGVYWVGWVSEADGRFKATVSFSVRSPNESYSLSASPDPVPLGGVLSVAWSKPTGTSGFIGVYGANGLKEFSYLDFRYPASGNSGTVTFPAPSSPGSYWLGWVSEADGTFKVTVPFSVANGSDAEAARFLEQSTFGPTPESIAHVKAVGLEQFLAEQFAAPISGYPDMPLFPGTVPDTCPAGSTCRRDNYSMYLLQNRFYLNALYGEDQLRQRVAFALHQIFIVSGLEVSLSSRMTPYLQVFDRNAFGNFRQLLYEITLNPAMGAYLDMAGNNRGAPNENYAREVLQLFTIGLYRLNPDGTRQLDSSGQPIPTYDQDIVTSFARVFTGWNFAAAQTTGVTNYLDPMVATAARHDVNAKTLLRNVVLPAGQTALKDLNDALDNIFNDPNVGPFISKQLIAHLVMSNPSPAYVGRVSSVFNNDGSGVRGNLRAVVRAILMDTEARGTLEGNPNRGHLRHPALFIAGFLRAFNAKSADGTKTSDGYLNPQTQPMGMDIFNPPSVFSYFSPSSGVPGVAGVSGPEFGILNTSTTLRRDNFINTMVFSRIGVSTNGPNGTSIDLSPYLPLANNPGGLVDALNALLMHGSISASMRQSIMSAVLAVSSTNAVKRVRTAVYLIGTSSQYQVER